MSMYGELRISGRGFNAMMNELYIKEEKHILISY